MLISRMPYTNVGLVCIFLSFFFCLPFLMHFVNSLINFVNFDKLK